MTLPFVFDIFLPYGSRMSPERYTTEKGSSLVSHSPSIIMRATQKKRMSWAVSMTVVG